MQHFIMMLLICSFTVSIVALIYMASMPLFSKRYAEKWRYYTWLIIVISLIIPFRPQWNNAIFTVEVPIITLPYSVYAGIGEASYFTTMEAGSLYHPTAMPSILDITNFSSILTISWWYIVFAIWLFGVKVFFLYHIFKHIRFMKTVNRWSEEVTDKQLLLLFEHLKSDMGIKKHIPLYLCPLVSPMIIGLIKPRIFLPTANMEHDDLCFILRHELVHYKRKDLLYKYFVMFATAMHWFNPITYLIKKAINIQCELSCDAAVIENTDIYTRQSYSEALLTIVQYQSKMRAVLSTNFFESKECLKNRISSIMYIHKKKTGIIITCMVAILTIGIGFIFTTSASIENNNRNHLSTPLNIIHPYASLPIFNGFPLYTIECTSKNIQFTMADMTAVTTTEQDDELIQPALPFEEIATIAANAIFQTFNFCIDAMIGYMHLMENWSGAIVSQELTSHSDGDELFTFLIDATTGNVLSLMKNTAESPFLG